MLEKEQTPEAQLIYGRVPPVLSVETLWITSARELSHSLWFKSFYWQGNKNPPLHLVNSLHYKFQSPGCSTARVPKHTSRAAFPFAARPLRPLQQRERLLTSHERGLSFKTPFQRWVSGRRPECRCKAVLQPCRGLKGDLVGALVGDVVVCRA